MSDLMIEHVFTAYDQADVLSDINLTAASGSITCILGANGAGKTTLIRSILGLTRPRLGSIRFGTHVLERLSTHEIVAHGIGCVPEGRRIFARMTVEENLRTGAYLVASERTIRRAPDQDLRNLSAVERTLPAACRDHVRRRTGNDFHWPWIDDGTEAADF
jgi:branched-chain amino acid transport system ATP-binding protein